jgi:YVTN family beta-propeller protein
MRPKQATSSQRIGGRARLGASAAATALVAATLGGCGGGGDDKVAGGTESFDLSAFTEELNDTEGSRRALPAYAVATSPTKGSVDIKVGSHPYFIAVNSKTNKAYVANNYSDNVTVIDGKTRKTQTLKAGKEPTAVAVNEQTNTIYVANIKGADKFGNADPNAPGTITVIDGKTNKTKTVTAGHEPYAIAINYKTNKIYIANQGSNDLTVLDGKTNKTKTIKLRPDNAVNIYTGILTPQDVKVNTVTNRVYVTGTQSNTLATIDGATNKILNVLKVEGLPAAPDAPTANLATSQTGLTPTAMAIDEKRNLIYAANFTSNDVLVMDGKTNKGTIIPMVDVQDPYSMDFNPVTNKLYVGNLTSRSITIIDGETKAAHTISDLPGKPHGVAINTRTNKVYFPCFVLYRGAQVGDDKQVLGVVIEIDGKTNDITTIVAGVTPYGVDINENTNQVYVMNQDSDNVTVITGG